MRPSIMVLASLAALLIGEASAGTISYNLSAGWVDGYANHDLGSGPTGWASFGVSKLAREHFEVTADVAYLHYDVGEVSHLCYDGPCPTSNLETSFVPISVGLIGYLRGPAETGPFAEFSPSLVVNRW